MPQFSSVVIATAAMLGFFSGSSLAQSGANVINDCEFPIYVQNNVADEPAGTPMEIAASGTTSFTITSPSAVILVSDSSAMTSVLQFEYGFTPDGASLYYDFNDAEGNPFAAYQNDIVPSNSTCPQFECAANSGDSCYSNPNNNNVYSYTCPFPVSLTASLCAPRSA